MTTDMQVAIHDEGAALTNNPQKYGETFLRVRDKNMDIVPLVYNRMQSHALPRLTGRDVFLKSRQLGVTTWVQSLIHQRVTTATRSSITLADTSQNTQKIRVIYNRFYEQWPKEYAGWRMPRDRDSIQAISYPLTDSESIISTAGSKTAGRAGTHSDIHCSEVAFWANAEEVFGGLLQAATPRSQIFLESTPNGAQGMFYDICQQGILGEGDWTIHFYQWWWDDDYAVPLEPGEVIHPTNEELEVIELAARGGFILSPEQIKWRRKKMIEPGMALLFAQEYPESIHSCFLTSGMSIFGAFDGYLRDSEQTAPLPDHRYVGGIDWGQTEDYTVLCILDANTGQEVYLKRWRRQDPQTIIGYIVQACQKWNVELLRPEANSFGRTNISILRTALENAGLETAVAPFTTTNESKRLMTDKMRYAIYNDLLHLMKINYEWASGEMRTFVQTQTANGQYKYDHMKSAKSDSVIARMAAWDGAFHLVW